MAHLAHPSAESALTEESRLERPHTVLGQVANETRQAAGLPARTVTYAYDYLGNISSMLYPEATRPVEYNYNDLGRLVEIPGFITGITYDRGLPQTVRYANDVALSYTYDRNGRLDTRMDSFGGMQLFTLDLGYDPNGNIVSRSVNGQVNTYTYDDLNQLVTANIYANQVEQVRSYDYGLGQVHEDYRGDKVVEVQPEDFIVDLDYAATSLSIVFNQVAQRIQRIELTPQEAAHRVNNKRYLAIYYKTSGDYQKLDPADWEFAHDAATGRITITFLDLLIAGEIKIHCLFDDRDGDYLPVKKRGATSEFANLARSMVRVYRVYERRYEDYVYDRNGNRISETITTLYPRTYGYTYYPNSDRLKTREASDGTTKWAFVYDNNGNLIEKGNTYTITGDTVTFTTSGEGVVYWQYQYDVFNRLVSVKKNGIVVSRYVYDPSGLRILKEAAEIKVYDYDLAGNVIVEKNLTTGKVYSYVWVSGRHLARVDGKIGESGAVKYFYETDHLGSPMVVTDQGGRVVWRGDYAPFGERMIGEDGGVFVDTHGFTGKDWDEDVGLYYFNARWYDSESGRFISEDQENDPNNPNLYVYCANNPLLHTDPTGNDLQDFDLFKPETWFNRHETVNVLRNIDIGIEGVTFSLSYTYNISLNGTILSQTTNQTFVNDSGDVITVSTTVSGRHRLQSYTIIRADGTVVKSEQIQYRRGVTNQRDNIAVENFLGEDQTFRALILVVGEEGVYGAFSGSTVPQNAQRYPTIQETAVGDPYEIVSWYHRGSTWQYPAFQLRDDDNREHPERIPIYGTNPNLSGGNYGQPYATGINIHAGTNVSIASWGCQNIAPRGVGRPPNGPVSRAELEEHWPYWVEYYDLMLPEFKSYGSFVGYYYLTRL